MRDVLNFLGGMAIIAIAYEVGSRFKLYLFMRNSDIPIYAWRSWIPTKSKDGVAIGGRWGRVWESPFFTSGCILSLSHNSPTPSCRCGIYALKTERFRQELESSLHYEIYGRVALSGTVIEHEFGYRASDAEIVEFIVKEHEPGSLGGINSWNSINYADVMAHLDSFGVPVTVYKSESDLINEIDLIIREEKSWEA